MTTHTSGAADRAIENCPELNMGNYDEVGVERLNDWAIRAHDEINRLHALAAGQATAAQAGVPANMQVTERMRAAGDCAWMTADRVDSARVFRAMLAAAPAQPASGGWISVDDAAKLERERICAAIKAEDDYCMDNGDYMLDSDDCIKIVRGEWVRPAFAIGAARAAQKEGEKP